MSEPETESPLVEEWPKGRLEPTARRQQPMPRLPAAVRTLAKALRWAVVLALVRRQHTHPFPKRREAPPRRRLMRTPASLLAKPMLSPTRRVPSRTQSLLFIQMTGTRKTAAAIAAVEVVPGYAPGTSQSASEIAGAVLEAGLGQVWENGYLRLGTG